MWIIFKDGSISITAMERNRRSQLFVRGRGGPLRRLLPRADIASVTDMHFYESAIVEREAAAVALAKEVLNLSYTSFEPQKSDLNPRAGNLLSQHDAIEPGDFWFQPTSAYLEPVSENTTLMLEDGFSTIQVHLSKQLCRLLAANLRFIESTEG